jgi:hypothetical protein
MRAFLFVVIVLMSGNLSAQQVADFRLTNVINNQEVSLQTYPSCEGIVMIFTSNNCPYDEYYRSRIGKLSAIYQDKVPVLLVNSNPDAVDSREKMTEKARQLNLSIPYLADKDQSLMTNLDARKSPEAFLLKNQGGKFTVVYRGAIDDNPQVEADVRHPYLRDAIDIMLTNQKIQSAEVRPVGCSLKKKP